MRFLMLLVGAMLAIASMQVSAEATTLDLGDVTNSTTNQGGVTFSPTATLNYDVTFSLSAASNVALVLTNFATGGGAFNLSGFSVVAVQSNPNDPSFVLTGAVGGPFSYAGLLAAGNYLISVTGTVTGTVGGMFQATVSAATAAVTPIPGALLLFMTAIGGMAGFARLRRRGAAVA